MEKKRTIFLTGATGLVGSYLLKVLLENGHKVYALARSKNNKSAKERVFDVLNFWDKDVLRNNHENLFTLEGDITKENLGLANKGRILISEVEEIFHCAAVVDFNRSLGDIRKVNVHGAKNVLEIALNLKKEGKLIKINHMSTIYVCGDYKGQFSELDLEKGQNFLTTYEQSKFEAEILVAEYRNKGLWVDTFRLPLIIGDSTTGKTTTFQGFYQMLQLWILEIFEIFPGKEITVNISPVDILAKCIVSINNSCLKINENYHIFGQQVISLDEVLDALHTLKEFEKPKLVVFSQFNQSNLTSVQKTILKNNIYFLKRTAVFISDMTNVTLDNSGFRFPEITREGLLALLSYPLKVNFRNKINKN
jgi:thioester reductase-like protein